MRSAWFGYIALKPYNDACCGEVQASLLNSFGARQFYIGMFSSGTQYSRQPNVRPRNA